MLVGRAGAIQLDAGMAMVLTVPQLIVSSAIRHCDAIICCACATHADNALEIVHVSMYHRADTAPCFTLSNAFEKDSYPHQIFCFEFSSLLWR